MSDYTDKLIAKIKREAAAKNKEMESLDDPISMAVSADDDAEVDMDFDNSISDGEYADDYFNDYDGGDGVDFDDDKPEDEAEMDDLPENDRPKKKDDKKKKKQQDREDDEYDPVDDIQTETYDPVEDIQTEQMSDAEPELQREISEDPDSIIDSVIQADLAEAEEVASSDGSPADLAAYAPEEIANIEAAADDEAAALPNETEARDIIADVVEAEEAASSDGTASEPAAEQTQEEIANIEAASIEETAAAFGETETRDIIADVVEAEAEAGSDAVAEDLAGQAQGEIANIEAAADYEAAASTAETEARDVIADVVEAETEVNSDPASAGLTEYVQEEIADTGAAAGYEAAAESETGARDVIADLVEEKADLSDVSNVITADTPASEAAAVIAAAPAAEQALMSADFIDHVIADMDGKPSGHTASVSEDISQFMAANDPHANENIQNTYMRTSENDSSYDSRAAVAGMVPDEQILGVTETYVSQRPQSGQSEQMSAEAGSPQTQKEQLQSQQQEQTQQTQQKEQAQIPDNQIQSGTVDVQHVGSYKPKHTENAVSQLASEAENVASDKVQSAGQKVVTTIRNMVETADENMQKGSESVHKVSRPLAETAAIIGMASFASAQKDAIKDLGRAGASTDKLIASGKISASDLTLSKSELNKTLKSAGVSATDRSTIVKNRKEIHDMMGVRVELQSMAATGQIKLDDKTAKVLNGTSFYSLKNRQLGSLLQLYYKHSSDNVIRNKLGSSFAGKSAKDFKKIMHKADRSGNGRAAIKMGERIATKASSRRELSGSLTMALVGTSVSMASNVTQYDKNMSSGTDTSRTVIKGAFIAGKIGKKVMLGTRRHGYKGLAVGSVRVVKKIMIGTKKHGYKGLASITARSVIRFGKYTDRTFYKLTNHSIGHRIGITRDNLKRSTDALRSSIKANGEIAKKKAIAAARKAKDQAMRTQVGSAAANAHKAYVNTTRQIAERYRKTQREIRKAAQKIAQTKAARFAAATGNVLAKGTSLFIGRPLQFGAGVLRKVKLAFGRVTRALRAVKRFLIIGAGIFVFTYLVLVIAVDALLQNMTVNNAVVSSVLLADRDEFISESIDRYTQKSQDIKDDAVAVGEGTPITNTVTSGHTIDKYGHPDSSGNWVKGYKIYYTDSAGNIIQDGANNVKDTMIMAYVQMDAEWTQDAEGNATDLMDRYFKWLNPNSDHDTLLSNSEESDIYFCDGCETIYYTCNDNAVLTDHSHNYMSYSDVMRLKNNGTKFFGSIVHNSNGDYYKTKCKGHSYIATGPDGNPVKISGPNHGSATNRAPSGCNNYSKTKYCTGHKVKVCYGHRDITIKIPIKTMQDAFDQNYMVSDHLFDTFRNGGWDDDSREWCQSLYDADWYDIYGKDPSGGIGFAPGSSLTPEQISEILQNSGDLSEIRQKILSVALSQIGKLPYYYGGKPTSGGLPIHTNHGIAGSHTDVKDHVGRTTAGLDCFGFCQWCYWNVFGKNVMPEGSSYTTTTVFNSSQCGNLKRLSSASELKVGDLGFMAGHVGIFAGVKNGKLMWIHCNGSASNVSYGTCGFSRFYRLNGLN